MQLVSFLNKLFNNDGFILIDANSKKYIIGNPKKEKPITLKLLKGLELGCSGIITATCNVTASLARKVYDDFSAKKEQTHNEKLCNVRKTFDQFDLISGLHSFFINKNRVYENILPPLNLLNNSDKEKLFEDLKKLNFNLKETKAA